MTNQRPKPPQPDHSFRTELPLAVLESLRAHDTPAEVLEDEDLSLSLPRRLGLTGVIDAQIQRYRDTARRPVPADEMRDLLRLVLRRPDGQAILREAGHSIARSFARRPRSRLARVARVLPSRLRARVVGRAARRMLTRVAATTRVEVDSRPLVVRMYDTVPARVDPRACVLYAAAVEELVALLTPQRPRIEQRRCAGRGDDCCEWSAVPG